MVVVTEVAEELVFERRRFGTTASERQHLLAWLREQGVEEAVMESTAQYWKPIGWSWSRTWADCSWRKRIPTVQRKGARMILPMPSD